jgi:hypothetical protein
MLIASAIKTGLVLATFAGVAYAVAPRSAPAPLMPEKPGTTVVSKDPSAAKWIRVVTISVPPPAPVAPPPVEPPRPVLAMLPKAPLPVVEEKKETPPKTKKARAARRCDRPDATARSWYRVKGKKLYCKV